MFFIIVGIFVYFLVIIAAVGLWYSPSWRATLKGFFTRKIEKTQASTKALADHSKKVFATPLKAGADTADDLTYHLRQNALGIGIGLLILLVIPSVALWWRYNNRIDLPLEQLTADISDPHIISLLEGEQLSPPKPLPPQLFATAEVQQLRPNIQTASRNWELLDPIFQQRLLLVFKLMQERHGLKMVILEGYRSPERQGKLLGKGSSVTLAGPGRSYHQYGLAADCAFMFDGKIVISEKDSRAARGYELYGSISQEVGLTWGGSWRSIKDLGHVEWRKPGFKLPKANVAVPSNPNAQNSTPKPDSDGGEGDL